MKLRDRLAELRRERRLTLKALRDRIEEASGDKLSVSYLSELEREDTVPPMETLIRIAKGYGLSVGDLLAPVDFYEEATPAQFPQGLQTLVAREVITADWAAALSRIEFRGRRPETEDQWLAIYSMLKAFMDPQQVRE